MIKKKRIRKLNPYKNLLPSTDNAFVAYFGVTDAQLNRAGFQHSANLGTTILPSIVGHVTAFNAEGKELACRNQLMETAYRTVNWHWMEWHGRDKIERSDFRDVPYKRYPREFIAPPSIELTLSKDVDGKTVVISNLISGWKLDGEQLIHTINIFLELFGECSVLDENKAEILPTNIQRINWKILPRGKYPFARIMQELKPVLDKVKTGKRVFVGKRLERLNSFDPEFVVMGVSGFSGYIVMAYPDRNLFILESLLYGNATYVLERGWEAVSKLTKAEILSDGLHKARIIHHRDWFTRVKDLFQ